MERREMKTIDKILALLLVIYIPLILAAGAMGVLSHFYGGILVVIVILLRSKFTNLMKGSGYKGYILFVLVFDFLFETAFWVGGFHLFPTYLEVILINWVFWFTWGTAFYYLAKRFDYTPTKALIIPAILGILVENLYRFGMYPLGVSLALTIVNGLNYSVEIGWAYWFVKGDYKGRANVLHYLFGIIALYTIWWVGWTAFSPMLRVYVP